ncbi:hypothetical protein M407DRAFT_219583 [Tulasnella calospora MUT 4182]|uniref:Uncharacterized protein n=1 Tax=Tulasnella calospora MUT 4182 TaxID=1051891 RepID=A0A0C3KHG9_9AGAM|nr:hypothetical protein M407DRAFT_219583 [Tulasnella calospora MUT 4182]
MLRHRPLCIEEQCQTVLTSSIGICNDAVVGTHRRQYDQADHCFKWINKEDGVEAVFAFVGLVADDKTEVTAYGNKINSQGQLNVADVKSMKRSWAIGRVPGGSDDLDFNWEVLCSRFAEFSADALAESNVRGSDVNNSKMYYFVRFNPTTGEQFIPVVSPVFRDMKTMKSPSKSVAQLRQERQLKTTPSGSQAPLPSSIVQNSYVLDDLPDPFGKFQALPEYVCKRIPVNRPDVHDRRGNLIHPDELPEKTGSGTLAAFKVNLRFFDIPSGRTSNGQVRAGSKAFTVQLLSMQLLPTASKKLLQDWLATDQAAALSVAPSPVRVKREASPPSPLAQKSDNRPSLKIARKNPTAEPPFGSTSGGSLELFNKLEIDEVLTTKKEVLPPLPRPTMPARFSFSLVPPPEPPVARGKEGQSRGWEGEARGRWR